MPLPSPLQTEPGRYGDARDARQREVRVLDPARHLHGLARLRSGPRYPASRRQRGPDGERPSREPAGIPAARAAGLRPVPPAERHVAAHQGRRPGDSGPGGRAAGAGDPAAAAVPAPRHHGDGPGDRGCGAHVAAAAGDAAARIPDQRPVRSVEIRALPAVGGGSAIRGRPRSAIPRADPLREADPVRDGGRLRLRRQAVAHLSRRPRLGDDRVAGGTPAAGARFRGERERC